MLRTPRRAIGVRWNSPGGAAAAEFDRLGIDLSGIKFWNALLDRYLGIARAELGPTAAETAWQAGRQLDFESAISEALSG